MFCFFIFFFLSYICSIWRFPRQGSNLSCSFDLRHSYSNTRSLTHCTGPGIELMPSQRHHQILNPLCHGAGNPVLMFQTFILFCLFKVPPVAYRSSQARSPIGAVAASLHHSHGSAISEPRCSWQRHILNPLSKARDQSCILMDATHVHYC